MKKLNVTIGIITYKRPKSLTRLLESLSMQVLEYPERYRIKILVVDNDASGENTDVVKHIKKTCPFPLDIVIEKNKGLCYARQRVVDETKKEDALVFIDDDEIAPPEWLKHLLRIWTLLDAKVVTGPVTGVLPASSPGWVKDSHYSHNRSEKTGSQVRIAYTNNVLIDREALDSVDVAFPLQFNLTGCEDIYLFHRLRRNGYPPVWCEEARIFEIVPWSRLNMRWKWKRSYRIAAGQTIIHKKLFGKRKALSILLRSVTKAFIKGIFKTVFSLLMRNKEGFMVGIRLLYTSAGHITGYFGHIYKEYDQQPDENVIDV